MYWVSFLLFPFLIKQLQWLKQMEISILGRVEDLTTKYQVMYSYIYV